jgi:hypothetical protein
MKGAVAVKSLTRDPGQRFSRLYVAGGVVAAERGPESLRRRRHAGKKARRRPWRRRLRDRSPLSAQNRAPARLAQDIRGGGDPWHSLAQLAENTTWTAPLGPVLWSLIASQLCSSARARALECQKVLIARVDLNGGLGSDRPASLLRTVADCEAIKGEAGAAAWRAVVSGA